MEDLYGRYDYFLLELSSLEIFFLKEMVAKMSPFPKNSIGFINIYLLP